MKMKAAEAIVKILELEGITAAFGIPGASINGLYKFLQTSSIRHYTHRHEECCVHAAGGFFRASGKMAVALCTSGPAATNFVTGLYTCDIDSIPLIAIPGQSVRAQMGKDAFQSIDIAKIAEPISKRTYCITDPDKVVDPLREAFRVAREGKPGPVLIDLPLDVQTAEIEFEPSAYVPFGFDNPSASAADIESALAMIKAAKKPLMLMGGGVLLSGAVDEFIKLAELLNTPVIDRKSVV
jgi:tartronate-semialdehyde synthase